jgi:hypothetical protein
MKRRKWYSDADLAAVQLVTTGSVDGSAWVVVAGDVLGTVAPASSARGTRSGWTARHRGGTTAWHLDKGAGGSRPATRKAAVVDLIADVHHIWREQQDQRKADARRRRAARARQDQP